jgi:TetR/AcrR family transcriptional regulator, lmrAB and yxaGH operons repressor
MAAAPPLARDDVVARILSAFRQYGYEGASLARLSAATGLGRSSLYHYFPNGKEDMATAAIGFVGEWFAANVLPTLDGEDAPAERLTRLATQMARFYEQGEAACLTDVFTIGEAGTVFQQRLGDRVRMLMGRLSHIAQQAGVPAADADRRAEDVLIGIQGSLIVSRATGSTAPFLRVCRNIPRVLLEG